MIGKALHENCLMDCYFIKSIYKMIIGQKLAFKDLEDFDNELYNGLAWMLKKKHDVTALMETMCVEYDEFGLTKTVDLVPDGRNVDVDSSNALQFVELKSYFHMY
jgi:E3 ubiquitin-protein ligase HUWE1